jgi:hypothetical protein
MAPACAGTLFALKSSSPFYGAVGTRALGFEPAAGSEGVVALGPGWRFSLLLGSDGLPAGDVVEPDSPAPMPSLEPAAGSIGAVGTRALGVDPAAGSDGVPALGPICRF